MFKRQHEGSAGDQKRHRPENLSTGGHQARPLLSMQECDRCLRDLSKSAQRRDFVAAVDFKIELSRVLISLHSHIHDDEGREYIAWEATDRLGGSQSIAFHLYNLGKLARQIEGGVNASLVMFMLRRINLQSVVSSKSIANGFYGLGLLAQAGQLEGRIESDLIQALLSRLISLSDIQSQVISNTVYGLGKLAQAGQLEDPVESGQMQALFAKLSSLKDISAQNTSNAVYGLGLLAQAGQLEGRVESGLMQALLAKLSSLKDISAQNTSNAVYGLGLLAQAGRLEGRVELDLTQALLTRLTSLRDIDPQEISNTIYGLGRIAQAGQFEGRVESALMQALLARLNSLRGIDSQNISNAVHGLGRLAQAGLLEGRVESSLMQALLTRLTSLRDIDSQAISNAVYGLARLAQAGLLEGRVESGLMQALLAKLNALDNVHSQEISNTIYGLGLLAQAGQLEGRVDLGLMQALLVRLPSLRDIDSQAISNTVYGLGLLAQADQLEGRIESGLMQTLLAELNSLDNVHSQEISNTVYGLGRLAQAGQLEGRVESGLMQALLTKLCSLKELLAQSASNTVYGLGRLAQAGQLEGRVESSLMQVLLAKLSSLKDISAQHTSNIVYGLGLLAQAGHLEGRVNSGLMQTLLEKLCSLEDISAQNTSSAVYGLGILARAAQLEGRIDSGVVQALLDKLNALDDVKPQGIANAVYGLGLLVVAQGLRPPQPLVLSILRLMPTFFAHGINPIDAEQMLFGLSELVPGRMVEEGHVRVLFDCIVEQSYLHPTQVARFIHCLVAFRGHHRALDGAFDKLSSAITIPLSRFPATLQAQLEDDLRAMADRPRWQSVLTDRLGVPQTPARTEIAPRAAAMIAPRPVPIVPRPAVARATPRPAGMPASWLAVCRENAVFAAIAAKDIKRLERLLGMLKAKSAEQVFAAAARPRGLSHGGHGGGAPLAIRDVYVDNQATANALTTKFLKETPGPELRELISRSTFSYFELMLRACSHHVRYQLAIDKALHNILLHLPIAELRPMVESLIQQGFYRDHRALLALVDALSIRLFGREDLPLYDRGLMIALRRELFDRAIEHHQKSNHHRVAPRLVAAQSGLEAPDACLLDDESLPEVIIPRRPVAQPVRSSDASAARSRSTLFAASSRVRDMQCVDLHYQYTAEDIEAILRARLKPYQDGLVILAAAHMGAAAHGNRVVDVLTDYLQHHGVASLVGKRVVIPINLGAHWVGVILEVDDERNVLMSYFNSSRNAGADHGRQQAIEQQLRDVVVQGRPAFRAISKNTCDRSMQQVDGTSCGAFLIENFYCAIKNQWWPAGSAEEQASQTRKIRMRHLSVLQVERADYYPGFLAHQQSAGADLGDGYVPYLDATLPLTR